MFCLTGLRFGALGILLHSILINTSFFFMNKLSSSLSSLDVNLRVSKGGEGSTQHLYWCRSSNQYLQKKVGTSD